MSRDDLYKLEKIEEILGVSSLERTLVYAQDELLKMRDKLQKTEAKLKEAGAKIAELESCGEGEYGRYINTSKGAVKVCINVPNDSGGVGGNLPNIKN